MTDSRRCGVSLVLVVLAALSACGKKGPPLPPLQVSPGRIEQVTVRRLGDDVYLSFAVPTKNSDGSEPADLENVAVFAITGKPEDALGRSLDGREFVRLGTLVGSVEVQPPPPPVKRDEAEEQAGKPKPVEPAPGDARPVQGATVTIVERLGPASRTLFVPPPLKGRRPPAAPTSLLESPAVEPPAGAIVFEPATRVYVAVGRTRRGRAGPLSPRLAVSLEPPPPAPPAASVTYSASAVTVAWEEPAGVRRRVQDPPATGELGSRPIVAGPTPYTYNVYEHRADGGGASASPAPLNPQPLDVLSFEDPRVAFGTERCYEVRTVEATGSVTVESEPSPPACVTPKDTFPPAAPRALAAVAGEGAINLIWEPNEEPDLAGYVVLRGEAPDGRLQALTPTPIRETTYRDATVRPGVRYVYAVVAVDTADPQNVSVESNRVQETAR